jgi:uncharacterized surface protein with fasciclin (FAS1) repeats
MASAVKRWKSRGSSNFEERDCDDSMNIRFTWRVGSGRRTSCVLQHAVDSILLPAWINRTLVSSIQSEEAGSDFFAPTDAAFEELGDETLALVNNGALLGVLANHVIVGPPMPLSSLKDGQNI